MPKQIAIQRAVRKMSAALGTSTDGAWRLLRLLTEAGFETLEDIRAASDEELLAISGIGPAKLAAIRTLLEG